MHQCQKFSGILCLVSIMDLSATFFLHMGSSCVCQQETQGGTSRTKRQKKLPNTEDATMQEVGAEAEAGVAGETLQSCTWYRLAAVAKREIA